MELSKEFKEMNCNETRERINESFDVDFQLNLPQYLDDIDTLVKCCVKNVVADYDLSSSSIIIYGKSIITVMYKASDGSTLSNIFEEEFLKTFDITSCDYPDFAHELAQAVEKGEVYPGIAICGTGQNRRSHGFECSNKRFLQKMYPLSFLMRKRFHQKQRKECFKH